MRGVLIVLRTLAFTVLAGLIYALRSGNIGIVLDSSRVFAALIWILWVSWVVLEVRSFGKYNAKKEGSPD